MGILIYVTHIAPWEAVILLKMFLLCNLGFQHADYISNLNDKIVKYPFSVAHAFILFFFLICYSNICNRLLYAVTC